MDLLFVHWNIDPEIFRIGPIAVRWYGLLFASAFFFGYLIMQQIFKREGLKQEVLDSLTMYVFIATVVGARLGHCLFYEPAYYLSHPLEILFVWHGGLASHGAAIAIVIGLWLFSRKHKKSFLWIFDRVVITVALGGMFIRLGNLANSEIYGHPTNLPWAFIFERENMIPRHPTQIYEALSYFALFALLMVFYFKTRVAEKQGFLFGFFLICLFGARFVIEFFKENQVEFEQGMLLNMGQWLSIPFILAGIALIFYALKQKQAELKS